MKRKAAKTRTQANIVTYGVHAEKAAIEVAQSPNKSKVELLGFAARKLGAKRAMVVRGISSTEIKIEVMWCRQSGFVVGTEFQRFIAQRLSSVQDERQIVPADQQIVPDSRSVLIHRLSSKHEEENWNRAIVLAGRSFAPVKLSSPGFLTFDFAVTNVLVTMMRQVERSKSDVPFSNLAFPLSAHASLYEILAERLGSNVQVICATGTLSIRHVPLATEIPDTSCQLAAEKCLSCMAIGIPERIWLNKTAKLDRAKGTTYEFDIIVSDMVVYGRRVTVRISPSGLDAEISIPMGWWWTDIPSEITITPERAQEIAANEAAREGNGEIQAQYIQSNVWPAAPPHRIIHVIRVSGKEKMSKTYFIDAMQGSIVRKRQAIRD